MKFAATLAAFIATVTAASADYTQEALADQVKSLPGKWMMHH